MSNCENEILNGKADGGSDGAVHAERPQTPLLVPETSPKPRRKIDLAKAAMQTTQTLREVESLTVQRMHGPGATFTPKLDAAQTYYAIPHTPCGEFAEIYQIVVGDLQTQTAVLTRIRQVAFVPVFAWATLEIVLMPLKLTVYGQRVLADLERQDQDCPKYKAYVQWVATKHRHVVYVDQLTDGEVGIIERARWPTPKEIQDALSPLAYDNLDELAAANEEMRTARTAREVK